MGESTRMSESEKTWKYSIKFSQSLTSGIIAFHGEFNFDKLIADFDPTVLRDLIKIQEQAFKDAGYSVASIIPNNLKDLADKKK